MARRTSSTREEVAQDGEGDRGWVGYFRVLYKGGTPGYPPLT